jgi:hypothetical protein
LKTKIIYGEFKKYFNSFLLILKFLVKCKELTYLDDRPIFPRDRACAEAWEKGGLEAEQAERTRWQNKERLKTERSMQHLR